MIALEFFKNKYEDDPIAFQYVTQVPQKGEYVSLYLEYQKGYQYFRVKLVCHHYDCISSPRPDGIHRAYVILEPVLENEVA